jgi:hypothetical protein
MSPTMLGGVRKPRIITLLSLPFCIPSERLEARLIRRLQDVQRTPLPSCSPPKRVLLSLKAEDASLGEITEELGVGWALRRWSSHRQRRA